MAPGAWVYMEICGSWCVVAPDGTWVMVSLGALGYVENQGIQCTVAPGGMVVHGDL